MKQGQDEWGRDGPYSRPSQFQRVRPRRVQTYRQPKTELFWLAKRILSTEVLSTDRFDASGHLNRAPAAALSAGIDQVKRAWPAWLPGLGFGTKCKKIRRISQISYCQWSTDGRTLALPRRLPIVYIRHARCEGRNFCLRMRYYKFVKTFVVYKVLRNYSLAHTCNDPSRQERIGG